VQFTIISQPRVRPYRRVYRIAKRIVDISFCLLVIPVAFPLIALISLLIRLDSSGPPIFVQERVGKGGRLFRMYKFRTMRHRLDDSAHRVYMRAFVAGDIGKNGSSQVAYKPFEEGQVTRVGRFLRKTSLDEILQIFNVLNGEMSLVGPRPNVPWEVEEYRGWHNERLEVLPGITGLAQVRGRSGISFDNIVDYDIEYIEKQCLALDLRVLWWTILSVLARKGAL